MRMARSSVVVGPVASLLATVAGVSGAGASICTVTDENADARADVPARYSRVDPWVISQDTDAEITFLAAVFGAAETPGSRMLGPDGRITHVEVELGDAVIMLFDAQPGWPSTPAHLRVYVASTRDAFERAEAAGAEPVTRPTDLAFGERVARVRDPQGHLWWIHQRLEDVSVDDLAGRFAEPSAQEAMSYVQQSLTTELSRPR
jgi:PhnB protein